MNKKMLGLLLFFSPELVLLAAWILFKSSTLDIRAAMFSQTIEIGSIRLIAISGILLAIAQALRICAFQSGEEVNSASKNLSVAGLIVIFFIILGIGSELPNLENVMSESYASMIMFFVTMTGAIYLFVEIVISLISRVTSIIKGR